MVRRTDFSEKIVWREVNHGRYEISLVARMAGPGVSNVQYLIRLRGSSGRKLDYMMTLEGFRRFGRLLFALSKFATLKVYADSDEDVRWLKRKILTPKKIRDLAVVFRNLSDKGVVLRLSRETLGS
jgi:hypothetical protein